MTGENGHHKIDGNNGLGNYQGNGFKAFPTLPIVTADPPRRSQSEKYGGLFYLGIGGLAVLISLIGWFGFRVWLLRDVWTNVYILHDQGKSDEQRIQAAFALSRNPRATTAQRWEIALRKELPELARYLIAESIGADIASEDPRGYPTTVARSDGWPDWLRLLLTRPIAYAAADGLSIPPEPLGQLRNEADPTIALWAAFAQSVSPKPVESAIQLLDQTASTAGPNQELAKMLSEARTSDEEHQLELLQRSTTWLRTHHPQAARIWNGWEVRDTPNGSELVHTPPAS